MEGRGMSEPSEWEWFGRPGHFCAADKCQFHLHTHVRGYCVSTVGDYRPWLDEPPDEIGYGRLYETMVFRLQGDGDIDPREFHMEPYNDDESANQGHMDVCWAVERGEIPEVRDAE